MSTTNAGMIETGMTEALGRFLDVDVARYKLIATNLANVDTPGYHTRDLNFRAELQRAAAEAYNAEASGEPSDAAFVPVSYSVTGLMERPDKNNVSVERESLLMAETEMRYNLATQLLKEQFHLISTAINSGGSTS